MKRLWFCILHLLFLCFYVVAQPNMLQNGEQLPVDSKLLGERRTLLVHLPDTYDATNGVHPVLIVLDGEWNFRNAVAISEHLAASGRIPGMIVVGITNRIRNGRPSRLTDLTPAGPGDAPGGIYGGAELFRRFLTEEVIPLINEMYHTAPHHILAGHSLGGLFSVYTMLESPEAFDAFVAISPSLGRNNQQQVERARGLYKEGTALPKAFHLSMGNEGGNTMLGVEAFAKVLNRHVDDHSRWHFEPYPKEDHVSCCISRFCMMH